MSLLRRLRTRRPRLRLAWLALLALLFQQVALAAYVCPAEAMPSDAAVPMAGCEDMQQLDPHAPLLCDQHCQRDHTAQPDLRLPQVPALALPPLQFTLGEALLPPMQRQQYRDVPVCRSDPPPAQRFCSLQI